MKKVFMVGAALLCLYVPSLSAYVIPDGSPVRWRCPGGSASVVAVTTLNKAAGNPFGAGPAGTLNDAIYAARYGRPSPDLCKGVRPVFLIYAEANDSQLQGDMHQACLRGEPAFQDQRQWDCWPGPNRGNGAAIEVEDYAATIGVSPKPGSATPAANATPGIPNILGVTSPAPGQVSVTWNARVGHDHFLVSAGNGFRQVPGSSGGPRYSTIVELPPGEGGRVEVAIRASYGGPLGKPSKAAFVDVEPTAPQKPPVVTPPPAPPADPQPPVTPPASPGAVCLEIPGQAGVKLRLVVVPAEECKP